MMPQNVQRTVKKQKQKTLQKTAQAREDFSNVVSGKYYFSYSSNRNKNNQFIVVNIDVK
jgi:hypothetical protein